VTAHYFNLRREVTLTAGRLHRSQSPRLHMFLIVALAAAIGFLTTFTLLHVGITHIWLRYACAVSLGYLVFLGSLWCWLHLRRDNQCDFLDFSGSSSSNSSDSCITSDLDFLSGGGQSGGGGASGSFDGDVPQVNFVSDSGALTSDVTSSLPDLGVGDIGGAGEALPLVAVVAVIVGLVALLAAVLASAWVVWSTPTFLGELVVDVALARGLYKHMTGAYDRYWLKTAMRYTFKSFLGLLVLLMIAGVLMQATVPNIVSLGQFVHYFTGLR